MWLTGELSYKTDTMRQNLPRRLQILTKQYKRHRARVSRITSSGRSWGAKQPEQGTYLGGLLQPKQGDYCLMGPHNGIMTSGDGRNGYCSLSQWLLVPRGMIIASLVRIASRASSPLPMKYGYPRTSSSSFCVTSGNIHLEEKVNDTREFLSMALNWFAIS